MKRRERVLDLFRLCSSCSSVIQLHSLTIKTGFVQDSFIAAKLSNCYVKYSSLEATRKLFDETLQPTVYIWNSLLKCYCMKKSYVETLQLFRDMLSVEIPDQATISIALKACSGLLELRYGRMLHGFIKKKYEMDSDVFVGSALIDMYTKSGRMDAALRVFEEYSDPDTVMWTHIITGYQQNGDSYLALDFFSRMLMEGHVSPDSVTLVSILSAYAQLPDLMAASCVHGFVIKKGFENVLSVCNALLNVYSKSGSVVSAATLFRKMEERDAISWASMVSCYAHNEAADDALNLFNEMMCKRVEPNLVSVISALQACEAMCNLEEGKKIHEVAVRKGFELDVFVSTALIDMYMFCSSPDEAMELFERMPKKDVVSWIALLNGCVQNGMAYKSMEVFVNMLSIKIQPDAILMVKILTSCSELGVLQQAMCLHGYVIKCGFEDHSFVGASLIESYSKCGSLHNAIKVFKAIDDKDVVIWSTMIAGYGIHGKGREAIDLFNSMVKISRIKPNNVTFLSVLSACSHAGLVKEAVGPQIWGALIGACRIHHNTKLGKIAASKLFGYDSSHVGYLILLSNMHAVNKDWDNVLKLRSMIKRNNLSKVNGQSAIEVKSEVHSFTVDDRFHPLGETIRGLLRSLEATMREEGCCIRRRMGIRYDVVFVSLCKLFSFSKCILVFV
ncbi:unnamed protein product [Lactuca virosa]|uniref:Pentatricopeptide repeat-containing protein n=1 Tax=Lactuca virosa TaxID=75947 RepID=A0AAU9NIP9_9ASTR|nr:unnamed protein product [Lactuca virosa]